MHVSNQRSRGVVIVRFHSFCLKPSSSTLRSPSIDLALPFKRSGSSLLLSGIKFQIAHEVLSCVFYLVFAFLSSSMKKPKKHLYFLLSYNPYSRNFYFQFLCWVCVYRGQVLLLVWICVFGLQYSASCFWLCHSPNSITPTINWSATFIVSVFSAPANNRASKIAWFQFWSGLTNKLAHNRSILVQTPPWR
jgi:hypothetical protein